MRATTGSVMMMVVVLAACGGSQQGASSDPEARAQALAGWETVRSVFQHARCQNCHPADDVPRQGEDGRLHPMEIQRGPTGHGMAGAECTTCHGPSNPPDSYGPNMPPGLAKGWHMPPPDMKMVFIGMSSRALCEQTKDQQRNGGKDMGALREHIAADELVLWGWNPGFGRAPVPVPHAEFVAAWDTWARAGAPCPD
jgi:hypothetical protein